MKTGAKKPSKQSNSGYTIGCAGFAKISEVEGVQLTPAMDADFLEFDRLDLSPAERRKAIAEKYGKAR